MNIFFLEWLKDSIDMPDSNKYKMQDCAFCRATCSKNTEFFSHIVTVQRIVTWSTV